jgi:hypothetical protein
MCLYSGRWGITCSFILSGCSGDGIEPANSVRWIFLQVVFFAVEIIFAQTSLGEYRDFSLQPCSVTGVRSEVNG